MAITQNASRIRPESAAKNGTLGVQGVLNADQVKFDTNISTNNGNLMTSPVFDRRHVRLRKGLSTEEYGLIKSVDGDGVTCTMQADWDVPPASGDTYDVSYRLEDVETIAGCDFETDSRQWVMTKRLIVGSTGLPGFLGMSHGQILRVIDNSPDSGKRTGDDGIFCIGTIKNSVPNLGASIIFMNDTDNELCWDILVGGKVRLNEFTLIAGRNSEGVNSLDVTAAVLSDQQWARPTHYGVDSPFKKDTTFVPLDSAGLEVEVGDNVTFEGDSSTVSSIILEYGIPTAVLVLADGRQIYSYYATLV